MSNLGFQSQDLFSVEGLNLGPAMLGMVEVQNKDKIRVKIY